MGVVSLLYVKKHLGQLLNTFRIVMLYLFYEIRSKGQVQFDRAVVTTHYVVVDPRVLHTLHKFFGHYEIVKSPADILGPASCPHRPPAVLDLRRVEVPERVDPSSIQKLTEVITLLQCESCCLFVSFWSGYVDLFVANVEISTKNNRFFLFE